MPEGSLIFPRAEFEGRIKALQSKMVEHGQDALLLTQPADVFYTTGFLTRFWESPARPWFIVVPQAGEPVAVIPSIGRILMGRTWISRIETWDAPDPEDDGISCLAEVLSGFVRPGGTIGVPMGLETHLRMPLADWSALTAKLDGRNIGDATETLQRVREIKSPAEVEKICEACRIADRAFQRVPDIVIGAPQLDAVFRGFQAALLEEGADWVSYVAGGAGQGGYGDVISPASSERLRSGDVLMLDTGAVKDGYFCDFDRNFSMGPISPDVARAQEGLFDATEDILAMLSPGMVASDVHGLFTNALSKRGFKDAGGRLGHGLGVTLTEWPSFTSKDRTPLREGMVLTLEPSALVAGDRMLVHEENILLTSDGAELLSRRAPRDMTEILL